MREAVPPWRGPAAVSVCGGGSKVWRRVGKTGETQRRKATELRRQPDRPCQGDAMSAGLHFGKPLETMGRKVLEAAASKGNRASPSALCPSDCD